MTKPQTERPGVAALEYFFPENGWLFREQTTHDYGIDAHVEIVVDKRPTGKLIALQIKAGTSFFWEKRRKAPTYSELTTSTSLTGWGTRCRSCLFYTTPTPSKPIGSTFRDR